MSPQSLTGHNLNLHRIQIWDRTEQLEDINI